jgi:hypothetical protein
MDCTFIHEVKRKEIREVDLWGKSPNYTVTVYMSSPVLCSWTPTFPLPGGILGKYFEKNHQQALIFLREMTYERTYYSSSTPVSQY